MGVCAARSGMTLASGADARIPCKVGVTPTVQLRNLLLGGQRTVPSTIGPQTPCSSLPSRTPSGPAWGCPFDRHLPRGPWESHESLS